ncbi:MAG TPA: transcription antitermination factor NusB [Kofleriaceae bacterium]|nr:transcription antitermination factor NusB [Kofleriaceae bacterium]
MSLGSRRKARALALQVLYAQDVSAVAGAGEGGDKLDQAVATYGDRFELDVDPEAREFAQVLVRAASREPAAVDAAITAASRNWRLERMAKVDRNILRLAVGELQNVPETPVKVVINEAVELAKRFGTAESPAFVNGVLDRVAHGLGRQDADRPDPDKPETDKPETDKRETDKPDSDGGGA